MANKVIDKHAVTKKEMEGLENVAKSVLNRLLLYDCLDKDKRIRLLHACMLFISVFGDEYKNFDKMSYSTDGLTAFFSIRKWVLENSDSGVDPRIIMDSAFIFVECPILSVKDTSLGGVSLVYWLCEFFDKVLNSSSNKYSINEKLFLNVFYKVDKNIY